MIDSIVLNMHPKFAGHQQYTRNQLTYDVNVVNLRKEYAKLMPLYIQHIVNQQVNSLSSSIYFRWKGKETLLEDRVWWMYKCVLTCF